MAYREVLDPNQDEQRPYHEVLSELMDITLGKEHANKRRSLIIEAGRAVGNILPTDLVELDLPIDGSSVVTDVSSGDILAEN